MKTGVVVGRFQVPKLHKGHKHLLRFAASKSDKLVVIIGSSTEPKSRRNPLTYAARKKMILSEFPDATIIGLPDTDSDSLWSASLDLSLMLRGFTGCTIYHSRDSIDSYTGIIPTLYIPERHKVSGTEIRRRLKKPNILHLAFKGYGYYRRHKSIWKTETDNMED